MSEWREGKAGAFIMGLRHGSYCVGCCWILMALLFVAGVMNLLWVAVIALFVLAEKSLPRGELLGHITGAALIAAGVGLIARAW
jgi:predicted metal-binding membrane protein